MFTRTGEALVFSAARVSYAARHLSSTVKRAPTHGGGLRCHITLILIMNPEPRMGGGMKDFKKQEKGTGRGLPTGWSWWVLPREA